MQGDFETNKVKSIYDFIYNQCFNKRLPLSNFFGSFSVPLSVDEAFLRSKTNIPKFLFYYLTVVSIAILLAIFTKFIIVVPISIIALGIYLNLYPQTISGVKITSNYILAGCISAILLFSIISRGLLASYLILVAFLSSAFIAILTHASLLEMNDQTDQQETKI